MPGLIDGLGQTTLILGAGASRPFGFPIGRDLHKSLETSHNERDEFLTKLGYADNDAYRKLVRVFQAESIDRFLAKYSEHVERAKLEIAYHLIKEENHFSLTNQHNPDHWYKYLHDVVLGDDENLGGGKLKIITFNYDLSLERYLCETNSVRHRLTAEQSRERMENLHVVHVHGHIGAMDLVHGKGRAYGEISPELLKEAASRMVTISESQTEKFWERAHGSLAGAKNVLFLGFAFAEENLKRLALDVHCRNAKFFIAPMKCPTAGKAVAAYVPEDNIAVCRDVESDTPTLGRAKWLFTRPNAPPPPARRMRHPGFGGSNSWMAN